MSNFVYKVIAKLTLVWPHPEIWELITPWLTDAKAITRTKLLKVNCPEICTVATSLAIVKLLYDGWLRMADTWWTTPPLVREFVPTRTRVLLGARPTVQWAAVNTHRALIIDAPQKWAKLADCREAWWGNWPLPATEPPTIRPSHSPIALWSKDDTAAAKKK